MFLVLERWNVEDAATLDRSTCVEGVVMKVFQIRQAATGMILWTG